VGDPPQGRVVYSFIPWARYLFIEEHLDNLNLIWYLLLYLELHSNLFFAILKRLHKDFLKLCRKNIEGCHSREDRNRYSRWYVLQYKCNSLFCTSDPVANSDLWRKVLRNFEVFHSMHSSNNKHILTLPNKCTIFILYTHLLYFSYMYHFHVHHHGELLRNCYRNHIEQLYDHIWF